jgi:hypothetical protein
MHDNKLLSKDDILKYFEEINRHLKAVGKQGEIIMCGGASLACIYNARNSTYDIDALFEPAEDIRKIISTIASEHDLNDDWLNDGVKGFLNKKMTSSIYKEYSNLKVYSIDTDCLLALKITSARTNSKDMDDSIWLMKHLDIKSFEEVIDIVEKYIPEARRTATSYFFAKEAFGRYSDQKFISLKKIADNISAQKEYPNHENDEIER